MALNGCVIFSKNIEMMSAFYQAVLDMSIIERSDLSIVLSNENYEIVIHAINEDIAKDISIDNPPKLRSNTAVKLVFGVDSLSAVRSACERSRGGLKDVEQIWEYKGCRVVDGWDPEGNVIQFRQPPSA